MAETSLTPQARIKSLVETEGIKKRFSEVLGTRANAFLQSVVSAYTANPKLSECDPMSVISSAMIAATLDLPINPNLGMAHIVPYKGMGTFQMGWKGFVQLGLRSGQFKTMNATVIYEGQLVRNDQFTGLVEFKSERTSDKVIGYLFYFKFLNGFEKYTYWTREECEAHAKKYSFMYKTYNSGAWKDDFNAMALKTVVKSGLSKWGLLSLQMQIAVVEDESVEGKYPDAIPAPDAAPKETGHPNRLKNLVVDKKSAVDTTVDAEPIQWGEPAAKTDVPI